MSLEDDARHRGATLLDNPQSRRAFMAGETKVEMSETLDQVSDLVDEIVSLRTAWTVRWE
jgi:hypothetical protein